ncbi:MAG: hypothetical protein H0X16_04230 [Chloroflexi bacterium]|nr:hypothetical protein [Chloroflexota bacterium]
MGTEASATGDPTGSTPSGGTRTAEPDSPELLGSPDPEATQTETGELPSELPADPWTADLAWLPLEAQGPAPAAREDHTWTVDAAGAAAYLYGGRDGSTPFGDLWRFTFEDGAWERLEPSGQQPDERFGHTATWVEDLGLVVWSGQAGSTFFDDLWAYDPETRSWRELDSGGEPPAARYGSCASIGPDGRLWISHGFTDSGRFADTRSYDFETGTWAEERPSGTTPVERCLHDCLWTPQGRFLLYGGQTNGVNALGDLWALTVGGGEVRTAWDELRQPDAPPARQLYAQTSVAGQAFIFGGDDLGGQPLNDLWALDLATLSWREVVTSGDLPSGRSGAALVMDGSTDRVLLFGGVGDDGALADLWELRPAAAA